MTEEPMDARELGRFVKDDLSGAIEAHAHCEDDCTYKQMGDAITFCLTLLERADKSLVITVGAIRHAEWLKISTESRGEINKILADLRTILAREGGG